MHKLIFAVGSKQKISRELNFANGQTFCVSRELNFADDPKNCEIREIKFPRKLAPLKYIRNKNDVHHDSKLHILHKNYITYINCIPFFIYFYDYHHKQF